MKFLASKRSGIWFVLVAEIVALTVLTSTFGGPGFFESTFLNWSNISQVIRALSFVAIMVVGQSVVIVTGGIDLAVGSVLGLSGVVTAVLLNENFSLAGACACMSGASAGIVAPTIVEELHTAHQDDKGREGLTFASYSRRGIPIALIFLVISSIYIVFLSMAP